MRLLMTPTSPYARKCRIVVRELGLESRVEEVAVDPYGDTPTLLAANPIAQVPALVTDEGEVLIDSPLICAWLDAQAGGRLLPSVAEPAHWRVRRTETLGQGVLEMAVKLVLESRRPESERSPHWLARWSANLDRALDAAEARAAEATLEDLGGLTLAVAVGYLDFRHRDRNWRGGRPRLAALSEAAEQRPSFAATRPPDA